MSALWTTLLLTALWGACVVSPAALPTILASSTPSSQQTETTPKGHRSEITETNWQRHPKIRAIRRIVSSVNVGLKKGTFKTTQRKFEYCPHQYFTLRRIARDSKGAVAWYKDYSEGEDSSWDYHYYYDQARRLRFVLITVYAANNTREQHRVYFDEGGRLIWQSNKLLSGPGYFDPTNLEELVKDDPAREFANDEGCKEIKPQPKRRM